MSDFVFTNCDICGQSYRVQPDRLGDSLSCKECGTKFKARRGKSPEEMKEEESEQQADYTWVRIRGACVAISILVILYELTLLLFYRPEQAVTRRGTVTGQPTENAYSMMNGNRRGFGETSPFSKRPGTMPGVSTTPDGRSNANPFIASQEGNPVDSVIGQTTDAVQSMPIIRGWELKKRDEEYDILFRGQSLNNINRVTFTSRQSLQRDVSLTSSEEASIPLPSEMTYEIPHFIVISSPGHPDQYYIAHLKLTTVNRSYVHDEEIKFVNYPLPALHVQAGGKLTLNTPAIVIVEDGGVVSVKSPYVVAFVKKRGRVYFTEFVKEYSIIEESDNDTQTFGQGKAIYRKMTNPINYVLLSPLGIVR